MATVSFRVRVILNLQAPNYGGPVKMFLDLGKALQVRGRGSDVSPGTLLS